MLACTLYIIHQIENRILVPFRNHFIYFRIYGSITISDESIIIWAFGWDKHSTC